MLWLFAGLCCEHGTPGAQDIPGRQEEGVGWVRRQGKLQQETDLGTEAGAGGEGEQRPSRPEAETAPTAGFRAALASHDPVPSGWAAR